MLVLLSKRPHRLKLSKRKPDNNSSNRRKRKRKKMTRRSQAPITPLHTPTYPFRKNWRRCLSTSSVTNPRRSIWKLRLSPSFLNTSPLLAKSMLSSRCLSLTVRKRTSVSMSLMNLALTTKIKLFWNSSMFKAKMWRAPTPSTSTLLIKLTRNPEKFLVGSAASRTCIRPGHLLLSITQRTCPISKL